MTNKEAYQLIESCLEYDKDMSENPEAYDETIRLAKKVFDKQEPMKTILSHGEYTCPMCEVTVSEGDEYCWHCGQKLDWEE